MNDQSSHYVRKLLISVRTSFVIGDPDTRHRRKVEPSGSSQMNRIIHLYSCCFNKLVTKPTIRNNVCVSCCYENYCCVLIGRLLWNAGVCVRSGVCHAVGHFKQCTFEASQSCGTYWQCIGCSIVSFFRAELLWGPQLLASPLSTVRDAGGASFGRLRSWSYSATQSAVGKTFAWKGQVRGSILATTAIFSRGERSSGQLCC